MFTLKVKFNTGDFAEYPHLTLENFDVKKNFIAFVDYNGDAFTIPFNNVFYFSCEEEKE